jgi:hypothetical protein
MSSEELANEGPELSVLLFSFQGTRIPVWGEAANGDPLEGAGIVGMNQ